MTSDARPPTSAERTTLASATTAAGGEIVEDLLLAGALFGELLADLLGEAQEHFAAHLDGELGRVPGQIEAGGAPSRVTRMTSSERNISLARSRKSRTVTTFMWSPPWSQTDRSALARICQAARRELCWCGRAARPVRA
jgi:hypothetical protein